MKLKFKADATLGSDLLTKAHAKLNFKYYMVFVYDAQLVFNSESRITQYVIKASDCLLFEFVRDSRMHENATGK